MRRDRSNATRIASPRVAHDPAASSPSSPADRVRDRRPRHRHRPGDHASITGCCDGCLSIVAAMSTTYRTVGWNPQKPRYAAIAASAVAGYLGTFLGIEAVARPEVTIETLLIRAIGSAAF